MKILVGIDGSNTSQEALKVAIKSAGAFNGELLAVSSKATGTTEENDEIRIVEEMLETAKSAAESAGVACRTHLLIRGNSAGEDIVKFADENGVDLIVVGVKRRSRVGKLLMGSSAQYVILRAACPVLTVK